MKRNVVSFEHLTSCLRSSELLLPPLSAYTVPAMMHHSSSHSHCLSKQVDGDKAEVPHTVQLRRSAFLKTAIVVSYLTYLEGQQNSRLTWADECQMGHCDPAITQKVFFDVAIDRQPIGQIIIGLFGDDVPIGAKRFAELAASQNGVGYRRKEFNKITGSYIQNAGLRSFSLTGGASDLVTITGGQSADALVAEMEQLDKKGSRKKNVRAAVSLVVIDLLKPPPKPKLVARDGKFDIIEEESRPDPNATEFAITIADAPELDSTNLVVGRVLKGMDVVERIASVKVVQDNSSSPYFQVAKLIGDSRAIVAERGFNKPYSKITITKSGLVT
ncbi:hypothetical protein O6H91_01G106900 [Diphasiastrum complanatum]|uniref:Uncharacterized protein n=1 Tax=Diphasiastrum complanatum TaxID=34168 RepID=A0ACC2EUF1_DIPCM|nr:hypothetical protein O6H91_01G106900 [Diphasiastrum complanatum]